MHIRTLCRYKKEFQCCKVPLQIWVYLQHMMCNLDNKIAQNENRLLCLFVNLNIFMETYFISLFPLTYCARCLATIVGRGCQVSPYSTRVGTDSGVQGDGQTLCQTQHTEKKTKQGRTCAVRQTLAQNTLPFKHRCAYQQTQTQAQPLISTLPLSNRHKQGCSHTHAQNQHNHRRADQQTLTHTSTTDTHSPTLSYTHTDTHSLTD